MSNSMRLRFVLGAAIVATYAGASGCATLIHGSHQSVPISVQPAGAKIQIDGSEYVSPVNASLARDKDYQVIASAPGYETHTTEIHSSFSAVTIIDLIFIIPWAVDLADGAAYNLTPESIQMQLQPMEAKGAGSSVAATAQQAPPALSASPNQSTLMPMKPASTLAPAAAAPATETE